MMIRLLIKLLSEEIQGEPLQGGRSYWERGDRWRD
jgi:hypothetical protein